MKYKMPITAKQFEELGEKKKSNEQKDKMYEELKALGKLAENAVSEAVRKEYGAEYMQTDDTTDDELKARAEAEISQTDAAQKESLTRETDGKIEALQEKAAAENEALGERKAEIERRYDDAKKDASNEALKRGMGRSSVIMNLIKEYDGEKLGKVAESENATAAELKAIDDEIEKLDGELKSTLEKMDMESAFRINARLDELKEERKKTNEKVVKYNNELAEKLAKYHDELESSDYGKKLIGTARDQSNAFYDQMVKMLVTYYSGLTADEAKEDFKNGDYASIFSPSAYKKVKTYVESRK